MEIFCRVLVPLHSSQMNFDANFRSQSQMKLQGSPNHRKTCFRMSTMVSSAVMASLHGMNSAALVQSWLVIVSMASYPCETSNLVMKSNVTVSKGIASGFGYMGWSGALVGLVLILFRWHSAHPFMYSITSLSMLGHQYLRLVS